jgi:hypothetical protein
MEKGLNGQEEIMKILESRRNSLNNSQQQASILVLAKFGFLNFIYM